VPLLKKELLAAGVDVIDLGPGDADLPPPEAAVEALAKAASQPGMSRYGFGLGLLDYRVAVSDWMKKRFGLAFDPLREVVPLLGSKEGIAHLAFAYLSPGDIAIVPEPGYLAYLGGTILAGAEPYRYPIRPRTNFLVDLDEIPSDILKRARVLYLNYPNNPTGAIASREYLEGVVRRCRELDCLLVYDNAYSELAFDGYVPPSIFEIEGAREIAVEFHSMSKTYNMTGWRCGWAVAGAEVSAALARAKTFVDTGAFMAVQAAAAAALRNWEEFLPGNLSVFKARRDAAAEAFRAAGFICDVPRATMYLWVQLPEGVPSEPFADRLLREEGVVVLPGASFGPGGEGFFRVSFIVSPDRLGEAALRAGRVLHSMQTSGA
jgi:LL-diaminopimelate aminotransferase